MDFKKKQLRNHKYLRYVLKARNPAATDFISATLSEQKKRNT
jgi:hypothetical protein